MICVITGDEGAYCELGDVVSGQRRDSSRGSAKKGSKKEKQCKQQ